MRKIYLFNLISLDGYFEGVNHDISWFNAANEEFHHFAVEQLNGFDMLLFGRVTYELMANYWPTETAIKNDPMIANRMNSLHKIVFSKTLKKADWKNTQLVSEVIPEEIKKLKQQPGKGLAIFGSNDLLTAFIKYNLIDEFRLMVNPIILGRGKSMFDGIKEKLNLQLIKTRQFKSGNVLLYYQPNQ